MGVCVCVGGRRRGVEKVKLGGEVGVYDGCVGMGMCVVWGGISMWGPGLGRGGAHHKFKRGAKFSFEATLNIWCQRKNHVLPT